MNIDYDRLIAWNGGEENGLADVLIWILESPENYENAKKEILEYSIEEN